MGIYIKEMEMPKEAGTYRIEFDQCGNPYLLSENGDLGLWHIISVPDHGDLIDRSRIPQNRISISYKKYIPEWAVNEAPVIIPADIKTMYYPQVDGITPTVIKPKREEQK